MSLLWTKLSRNLHAMEEHVPCHASCRWARERMTNSRSLSYRDLKLGHADPHRGALEVIWKSHHKLWRDSELACISSTQNSSRNIVMVLLHWEPSKWGNSTTSAVKAGAGLQQGPHYWGSKAQGCNEKGALYWQWGNITTSLWATAYHSSRNLAIKALICYLDYSA